MAFPKSLPLPENLFPKKKKSIGSPLLQSDWHDLEGKNELSPKPNAKHINALWNMLPQELERLLGKKTLKEN